MPATLHAGEADWLARIVANLADDDLKLVYADWLEDRGDERARFVRDFVAAARTMHEDDFPAAVDQPEEWVDLLGDRLLRLAAEHDEGQFKDRLLRLARPALRYREVEEPPGRCASKRGGLPDLPPGFAWPLGQDCRATYNDPTTAVLELAGFVAQINLAEIAHAQALRGLPTSGLLSFFCFQDIEHDCPDTIGARVIYFPDSSILEPTEPLAVLIGGNELIAPRRLVFAETLDLPSDHDGPWSAEFLANGEELSAVYDRIRSRNFHNFLGYARSTSGPDPTANRAWRHLIYLQNAPGCGLHLQVTQADLAAFRFDNLALAWVDFD